ncbi:MAG: hypothetical protein ACYCV7_17155 [Acidimicrobiales bacterium]
MTLAWTGTFSGKLHIAEQPSASVQTLTPEDLESMLDSMMDSLVVIPGVENVSAGAALASGMIEVTFSMNASSFAEAQSLILNAFTVANTAASMTLADRIGIALEGLADGWQSSRVEPATLVST